MARSKSVNTRLEQEALEDILDAYVEAVPEPSAVDLAEWIRRYPQYREELTAFTVSRSLMHRLPPAVAEPVEETVLVTRGMSVVRSVLQREREQRAEETPPASLTAEGRRLGLSLRQVAERAGLTPALWRELDQRLFRGVPAEVIGDIARAIGRAPAVVERYLQGRQTLVRSHHRAAQAPVLAEPRSFFDAVREDPALSDERRAYLLALEPREPSAMEYDQE